MFLVIQLKKFTSPSLLQERRNMLNKGVDNCRRLGFSHVFKETQKSLASSISLFYGICAIQIRILLRCKVINLHPSH